MTISTSLYWQPALNSDTSGIVEGVEDIDQCIRIILGTPKGSDPLRPDFGCNAWKYLDQPIDTALPHVVRESVDAIKQWEPRVEVVKVVPSVDESHLTLRVVWRIGDQAVQTTEVAL